jgi:hypothetical protein
MGVNEIYNFEENSDAKPDNIIILSREPTEHVVDFDKKEEPIDNLALQAISKYNFKDIDTMMREAFTYEQNTKSMICDIIAMYLKGQKILYTEAKTLCEQRLNFLMLPAIFITAVCTILSLTLKDYEHGSTIVSSLNGFNAFLLALISYLKLDAKAESHKIAAYRYDKLQSNLEFNSGKILFIDGVAEELPKIIGETESNVKEIKETNQFILPESIRYNYPITCNTNVFTEVKRIQCEESVLINKLKEVLNERAAIFEKIEKEPTKEQILRLSSLDLQRKELTEQILKIKEEYFKIDDKFEKELQDHLASSKKCSFMSFLNT